MHKRVFILLAFLIFAIDAGEALAQTITIGSGTQTNGVFTSSPVNIRRRKTVCQIVYTAAELNAAGLTASATLNQLGWFVSNPPIYDIPGYTIQMKHTTATNAAPNLGGGWTTVVNSFTYAPGSNEWDMLTLDNPFTWDGTNNVAVRVCWSQTAAADPSGQVRTYTSTSGYKYRWANGGGSYCGATPNTTLNYKPQVRMIFDTVTVWTGAASTDWNNPNNWTAGLPDATMHARIPTGVATLPTLSGTGIVKNIYLEGTLNHSGNLEVWGNFENSGTLNDISGTTTFYGNGSNLISTTVPLNFETVVCESNDDVQILNGPVIINEEIRIEKGVLEANGFLEINSDATGTARIGNIATSCEYTVSMTDAWGDGWNGGFLEVYEDGVLLEVIACKDAASSENFFIVEGRTLEMYYTSGTYENENQYTLFDQDMSALLSDGPNPSTGLVYTEVASGCNFQSTINGDVTVERYIDAGETYWRYFSSAVQGATVSQYNDDFTTAGYTGSHFPTFPFVSVWTYTESLGAAGRYQPIGSATDVIGTGQGLQVYCGDTITGTTPFVVDLTGPANQGDVNLPVSYTVAIPSEDGYCMVGNPYASAIDWDAAGWTKLNMNNATYILDPDTKLYATYVGGASTNGGSRYIASQQSFWVRANAAGPQLTVRESCKSQNDPYFFREADIYDPGCTISLQGLGDADEAVIRHRPGLTQDFEGEADAKKLWGGWGEHPQISILNPISEDYTIQTFDLGADEWHIPLRAVVFTSGTYFIEFTNTAELGVPCMVLEDAYDGSTYPIEESIAIPFEMSDTTYAPRFILHIGKNYETTVTKTTCYGDYDGSIEIDLDISSTVVELTGPAGTSTITASADPLVLNGLGAGIYHIDVPELTDMCGTSSFDVFVGEPSVINPNAEVVNEIEGGDAAIVLSPLGGTAPYSYLWNTGAMSSSISGLTSGFYSVIIQDDNGCEVEEVYEVKSVADLGHNDEEAIVIYYQSDDNSIMLQNLNLEEEYNWTLHALDGRVIATSEVVLSGYSNHIIKLPNLAKGGYVLRIGDTAFKFVR